jgi:hypothetical protein
MSRDLTDNGEALDLHPATAAAFDLKQELSRLGSPLDVNVRANTMRSIDGDDWADGTYSLLVGEIPIDPAGALKRLRQLRPGAPAATISRALISGATRTRRW